MRARALAGVAVLCVAAAITALAGAGATAKTTATQRVPASCLNPGDRDVRVLIHRFGTLIFSLRFLGDPIMVVCIHGNYVEDDTPPNEAVQLASVAITPGRVAYASTGCMEEPDVCEVLITQFGNSRREPPRQISVFGDNQSAVSRITLGAHGALAWISCHLTLGELADTTHLIARCRRPRSRRKVAAVVACTPGCVNSVQTVLDSGRYIDPFTLRIRHGRVYWRHAGRTRSAKLPPPRPG
jgi:hypothetical protein